MSTEREPASNGEDRQSYGQDEDLEPYKDDESREPLTAGSILRGLRETAAHMLSEARAEASRAKEEAWDRYAAKTKHRRDKG